VQLHQERVERYHKIHDLSDKKVDPANIARQVGISRQSVYAYLKMKEPPARTRIHRQSKPLIDPYQDYRIKRQMYGRGSFTLLRKRVLHRAEIKRRQRRAQEKSRGLGRRLGDQLALAG